MTTPHLTLSQALEVAILHLENTNTPETEINALRQVLAQNTFPIYSPVAFPYAFIPLTDEQLPDEEENDDLSLEAHLDHLSHQEVVVGGAGLSYAETQTIIELAQNNPAFANWLFSQTFLDLIFLWLEQHAQPEAVDLIASGYEWTCPVCNTLNHEIETQTEVTCQTCQIILGTDETHHAYG